MTVMASKCPDLIFNVVDINKERISSWNNSDLSKLLIFKPVNGVHYFAIK